MKTRFSLITMALGLGMMLDASAAPSVRVLGSNAGYSAGTKAPTGQTATAVKTGNNINPSVLGANTGAKKAASIKNISPKTMTVAPAARSSSNRQNTAMPTKTAAVKTTAAATTDAERFPGIATKTNIQSIGKTGTTAATTGKQTSTGGYNIKEMDDRLGSIEDTMSSKVDTSKLDDYYTKEEIDDFRGDYYTAEQIDERLSEVPSAASSYMRYLTNRVNNHETQLEMLSTEGGGVYDNTSGTKQRVYFVSNFDADTVLGPEPVAQTGTNGQTEQN